MLKLGAQYLGTSSSTTTSYILVTVDPSTDYLQCYYKSDINKISNNSPVTIIADTMPSPLLVNTIYYIINIDLVNTKFQLSTTIGGSAIDITTAGSNVYVYLSPSPITSQYPWSITWKHRTGGIKRTWYYGQDNCPIVNFKFERNLSGCGAGIINLAYIDFPIDAEDLVYIYRNNSIYYLGMVDTIPDIKGGELDLIPIWKKYENSLYNGTLTTQTIAQIISTVVSALATNTGIAYNASLVSTGSSSTYTITYNYETGKKIFDDLTTRTSSRYWGVNESAQFYLKQYETSVSKNLFYSDPPAYTDIQITKDYSGIPATRYQVYYKNSGNTGTTRAGEVGYGGSYPSITLEKFTRVKEAKITVPDNVSSTDALTWAYALLQTYSPKTNITVNNINLDRYEPYIGQLVQVQDREDYELTTKITCDSTTGWKGATLDTTTFVEGTGSVKFTSAVSGAYMEYVNTSWIALYHAQKIGFMVYATNAGSYLTVKIYTGYELTQYGAGVGTAGAGTAGIGDTTVTTQTYTITSQVIIIQSANVWTYQDFAYTGNIYKIKFEFTSTPPSSTTVYVDRIQVYQLYRAVYTNNVVQIDYEISPEQENVTAHLLSYDTKANDQLFALQQSNDNLTTISSS